MPPPTDRLRLVFRMPEPGEESPQIVLLGSCGEIGRISTDDEDPSLPLPDASVSAIEARDAIEHGHDEQRWLAELARVAAPGCELLVRVPLDNGLAWLDALNIYRYLSDAAGRGSDDAPLETVPTGWHRRYPASDIAGLVADAGFAVTAVETEGLPIGELAHLVGLIATGLSPDARAGQRRLFRLRDRFHHRPLMPLPRALASRVTVRAIRRSQGTS